jgi:alpha-L-fucosidase
MKKLDVSLLAVATTLLIVGCSIAKQQSTNKQFDPFNETSEEYDARAQWFRDAKLGVMVCWNPSSLVGKTISHCRGREIPEAQYDVLYKRFTAEKFDAKQWIDLFEKAGFRYSVFVPKHHDGFSMYDTKVPECQGYTVMKSPFGRDFIKEVAEASKGSKVKFGLYYSIIDTYCRAYDGNAGADLTEYNSVMMAQFDELLTKYGDVGCIWFDGNWGKSWANKYARDLYAHIRQLQPNTLIGNRIDDQPETSTTCTVIGDFYDGPGAVGDYQAREHAVGTYYTDKTWDLCLTVCKDKAWSYKPPMNARSLSDILNFLFKVIGRDGSLLLGVGPMPDGTIDPATTERLLELGEWMDKYGDAVYGTRGGPYLPGEWGVSTRKSNKVFLFIDDRFDRNRPLVLPALPATINSARMLTGGKTTVAAKEGQWEIKLPTRETLATIVELELDRDAMGMATIATPLPVSAHKPFKVSRVGPVKRLNCPNDFDILARWAPRSNNGWVEIDLEKPTEISRAMIYHGRFDVIYNYTLKAKLDDEWTIISSGARDSFDRSSILLNNVEARHFRLELDSSEELSLGEFELYENK